MDVKGRRRAIFPAAHSARDRESSSLFACYESCKPGRTTSRAFTLPNFARLRGAYSSFAKRETAVVEETVAAAEDLPAAAGVGAQNGAAGGADASLE